MKTNQRKGVYCDSLNATDALPAAFFVNLRAFLN